MRPEGAATRRARVGPLDTGRPRAALHLLIDRQHGDIGVARAQLQQIDQALLGNSA